MWPIVIILPHCHIDINDFVLWERAYFCLISKAIIIKANWICLKKTTAATTRQEKTANNNQKMLEINVSCQGKQMMDCSDVITQRRSDDVRELDEKKIALFFSVNAQCTAHSTATICMTWEKKMNYMSYTGRRVCIALNYSFITNFIETFPFGETKKQDNCWKTFSCQLYKTVVQKKREKQPHTVSIHETNNNNNSKKKITSNENVKHILHTSDQKKRERERKNHLMLQFSIEY